MKKFFIGILSALVLFGLAVSPAKTVTLPSPCQGEVPPSDELVIDVTQSITNDIDSGVAGFWAYDNYSRSIRVWEETDIDGEFDGSHFCAQVDYYNGTFDVQPGVKSPNDGSIVLSGDEDGTFSGGRRAIIDGSLSEVPEWVTTGDVGSFDYGCNLADSNEEGDRVCSNLVKWQDKYFGEEYDYSDLDWGWTYTTCDHGIWVNASSGNSGNIVPESDGTVCTPPTTDVCANIDGDQAGVPDGLHLDASGLNCVAFQLGGPPPPSPATAGQVLGASTLGATGAAEENIFLALFALGSILVGTGVRKLGVSRK